HRADRRAERARRAADLRSRAGHGAGAAVHGRAGRRGADRPADPSGISRRQHQADGGIAHMDKGNGHARAAARLAVDIGGTFTDLALEWRGRQTSVKVLTTPRAPEEGVLTGITDILKLSGATAADFSLVVHGTTLATNAIIERKGAKTALVVT